MSQENITTQPIRALNAAIEKENKEHISLSWRLPDGIEDHIESGIIKTATGAVVGRIIGGIFKSGSGWRSASAALGVGIACGSVLERALGDSRLRKK